MKIAYFGTGNFSKEILSSLFEKKDIEILLVLSQIDKPIGRKKEIKQTPVKEFSIKNNINIMQPQSLKNNTELLKELKELELDFIVVAAYGKIIPKEILVVPKYGCINVHGSILPKYRGASPIQEAIKNGETKTGVTIMFMSEGMDEGDILSIKEVDILFSDKTPDIFKKFEDISLDLLHNTLKKIISSELKGIKQNDKKATYCTKINKEDGKIDFFESAIIIYNKYRAFFPWPGIFTFYKGKKFDIIDCFYEEDNTIYLKNNNIGDVIEIKNDNLKKIGILFKDGIIILNKVKIEGKKEVNIFDFINGNREFLKYNFNS